jgi:hypothetical protein
MHTPALRPLGRSGLLVWPLRLGGNVLGRAFGESLSLRILAAAVAVGLIDRVAMRALARDPTA